MYRHFSQTAKVKCDEVLVTTGVDGTGYSTIFEGSISPGYDYIQGVCWRWVTNEILFNIQVSSNGFNQDLFKYNTLTTNISQITDEWGSNDHYMAPAWSPDGLKIAVLRQPGASPPPRGIYVLNSDGTGVNDLTVSSHSDGGPRWSPDGSKIVFHASAYSSSTYHIWLMNSDGSGLVQLTTNGSRNIRPDIYIMTRYECINLTLGGESTPTPLETPGIEQITYVNRDATFMLVNIWPYPPYIGSRNWNSNSSIWDASVLVLPGDSSYGSISPDEEILIWSTADGFLLSETIPEGGWTSGEYISGLPANVIHPYFNGSQLYISEEQPGDDYELWVMDFDKSMKQFFNPRLIESINTEEWSELAPWISEDGNLLIFASDRPGEGHQGEYDLWYATWDSSLGQWTNVTNLGPEVNTDMVETMPRVAEEAGILYFQRRTTSDSGTIMQVPISITYIYGP